MGRRTVWIAEDFESEDGDWFDLGRFSGFLDEDGHIVEQFSDLSAEEAIVWGRARAVRVFIRGGGFDYHSAGEERGLEMPAWPPAGLPELVRRRPLEDAWKDRTDDDAPIDWRVTVCLTRTSLASTFEHDWDEQIAALAVAVGADGWDRELLDESERARQAAARRAEPGQSYGWFSYVPAAWRIVMTERAPCRARAIEQAQARVAAPAGWVVSFDAQPH